MENVTPLKTTESETLVKELERVLAEARKGKVAGFHLFVEIDGRMGHSRHGFNDSMVIFWFEFLKKRILEGYG